jgi:branched-chain amino acid transport system substrate-binding protein
MGALTLLGSCAPSLTNAQGEQVITLGFAGGLGSKLLTNLSFSVRDGALLAIEEANRRNIMLDGKPVRFSLLAVDDQSDPNFARITAKSFVTARVAAVIGHNTSDTSVATTPIYAEAGIALISPTSTGRTFTSRGYGNVFQLLGHSEITSGHLADAAINVIRARRIVILGNGTQLGVELADGIIQKLKQLGVEPLAREAVTPKTSDFNAVLARLKHMDPDLLFFTGGGPQIAPFLQNFQRLELHCKLLVTGGAVNVEFPRSGPYPEGTYLVVHGLPPEKRPGYADFEKAYRRNFDTAINAYTMFAYDAVGMVVDAIRRLDSSNPRLLIAELHRAKYKGISGNVSFGTDGSQIDPPYTLYQATQQNWRQLKTYGG